MYINSVESNDTSSNGSLDIGIWNCDYPNCQKFSRKTSSLSNDKSISFHTWDFSGDVSNAT